MRLIPKGLSIRYYISALLIVISALGLILAWGIYRRASEPDLPPPAEEAEREGDANLSELERLFQEQPGDPGRYGVIVDKNLFSEQRRAATDAAAPQAGQQAGADRSREVQLLGTSILGERKSAMLRFPQFQGRDKVRIAEEGQTLRDEPLPGSGAGSRQSYTVTAIERRRVTLTDQAGQSFTVSLAEPSPAAKRPQGQEGVQDEGQGDEETTQLPREPQPEEGDGNLGSPEPRIPARREARQGQDGEGRDARVSPPSPAQGADNTGAGTWSLAQ